MEWIIMPVLCTLNITNIGFRWWFNSPTSIFDIIPWVFVFGYWGILKRQNRLLRCYGYMVDDLLGTMKEGMEKLIEKNTKD